MSLFQKARMASAGRIADNIKTLVDGTTPGKKPDHVGVTQAALIAEVTQLAATLAVLESRVAQVVADMSATTAGINEVVKHLTNPGAK